MAKVIDWLIKWVMVQTNSALIHTKFSFDAFVSIYLQEFELSQKL